MTTGPSAGRQGRPQPGVDDEIWILEKNNVVPLAYIVILHYKIDLLLFVVQQRTSVCFLPSVLGDYYVCVTD